MQYQAVVDKTKKLIDLSVGMHRSMNDSWQLRQSMLYYRATTANLFSPNDMHEGLVPYLVGDKGYPLLPWLIKPYRELLDGHPSVQERLFNRKLSRACSVVENAFSILQQSFIELLWISDLHVTFLPDVIVCCCLLHNILLGHNPKEVNRLLAML